MPNIIKIHLAVRYKDKDYLIYDGCNKHLVNNPGDLHDDNAEEWFEKIKTFMTDSNNWDTISTFMGRLVDTYGLCHDRNKFQDETRYFHINAEDTEDTEDASEDQILCSRYDLEGTIHYDQKLLPLKITNILETDKINYPIQIEF